MRDHPLTTSIQKVGKFYEPALLPEGIERGDVGKCFDTCMMAAIRNPHLRYVEGVAMTFAGKDMVAKIKGKWVLHAWLTDGEKAFDPTWYALDPEGKERVMPTVYVGIEMDIRDVAAFVKATEYQGVIANRHRHPELSRKALKIDL